MTTHVSTSASLFLKLVFPTVWMVFFTTLLIGSLFSDYDFFGPFPARTFQLGLALFILIGVSILYWMVLRLKRVDMDKESFYVTNYFKSYRYTYDSLENIKERDYAVILVVDLFLKEPGSFGKKMTFVASRNRYKAFVEKHPELFKGLLNS